MMGFLVPGFLFGLALAAIPLVIHLIYRRKAPQVVFAATRFLKVAARRTARRRRIDNLMLLLLRMLLLALLAFALAGPVVKRAVGSPRAGCDVVIVVDNSMSMSAVEDGVSRSSRAKQAVDAALSRLKSGDLAALIATAPPDADGPAAFTPDISGLRARAARLCVSNARGSLAAAFGRAAALFAGSASFEKLMYVVTDLQSNSFPDAKKLADETRTALVGVDTVIYDCGAAAPRNIAVTGLSVATQGGVVGTALEVTAAVSSNSPVEETFPVSLLANGERLASRAVTLAPGSRSNVSMSMLVARPGPLSGAVSIETSDAVAADNRRFFRLVARDRIRALILKSDDRTPEFDDDAFFLRRALDPFFVQGGGRSPFDVAVKKYGEAGDLGGYDTVYLVLRGRLPDVLAGALADYALAGGNLVVFPAADPSAAGGAPWLPARLLGVKSARRATGEAFSISSLDTGDALLAAFAEEPPAFYNTVHVYDYWLMDLGDAPAKVLARFDTLDPAIVASSASGARVVLFALAPTRTMSALPASQLFLPLVYEISYHLVASSGVLAEVFAGDPAWLAAPGRFPRGLYVTSPDGRERLVAPSENGAVRYDDTDLLGSYRVRSDDAAAVGAGFCVNADPAESDLSRLHASAARRRAANPSALVVSSVPALDEALASLKPALALGDIFLYAVVAVAMFECLAANRVSGRSAGEK